MAAYGALVSLMHIIDTLDKHPSPPISIDKKQVQSLTQNVTFLQKFLDGYTSPVSNSDESDPLERRIADAVYAAEDVIESQIVVQIDKRSTMVGKMISVINLFRGLCKCVTIENDFYHDLQQVIEEMDLIQKEATETAAVAQLHREVSSTHAGSLTPSSTVKENVMVGFDEVFLQVLDKLTGDQHKRQIIPIMGMGGIGKTTLARNLFESAPIKEHFDIRAWTTISQTYNVRETLGQVLFQASGESSTDMSEHELGDKLYKFLYGRRYLVTMDDMWSVEVWEKIKFFFPDNENGSRIIVTTRLSNLSSHLNESYRVGMKFLDEASSWDLFCTIVFGIESCPLELENIGKNIVANCKGLPLSIATIGGLLAKSERTREYWERIAQNLNSVVINSNDEFCLKILRMSYIYLPNYLKPCFLYMGVFDEDRRIRVSMLMKLWVSEGFLKARSGKCLKTIAKEYLKELVDRNLIIVDKLGSMGNVKFCKIHDLLRDLCLKEVEKERLYDVVGKTPSVINCERRVVFPTHARWSVVSQVLESLSHAGSESLSHAGSESLSHIRSLVCDEDKNFESPHNFRLLRTFKAYDKDIYREEYVKRLGAHFLDNVFQLVNSRHIAIKIDRMSKFPSSINLLWNLNTLIVHRSEYRGRSRYCINQSVFELRAPIEIWKLHQLRHLEFVNAKLILPDPPRSNSDTVIMENLQTLIGVLNLDLDEEVVKRIPNVKKLHLRYFSDEKGCLGYLDSSNKWKQKDRENSLSYLECLSKLENLEFTEYECDVYLERIRYPQSLKKLVLCFYSDNYSVGLEDILEKIGSLPLLQKLKIQYGLFKTGKWETTEGQFQKLKLLKLKSCRGLENWTTESSHFPLLQKLSLVGLDKLEGIPSEVGEIVTLKSLTLKHCSETAVVSAKDIVEEQEDLYGDQLDLHVRAVVRESEEALKSLASANFEVKVSSY